MEKNNIIKETKVKKILSILLLAGIICFAGYNARAAKITKMNLNAIYGPTSIHTLGAIHFAKLVDKYTNGTVKITVYPGGSLGFKGAELLRVVKEGQVPMSDILMGVVSGSAHVFGISSLPRLVLSYKAAKRLYRLSKPLYKKAALKWNQKFLYAAPWPPSGLVTKKPIKSAGDLKDVKIRTYDRNGAEFLRYLGASAVSMPWGDLYSALRTGLVNGVLTSAESTKNGKFWEVLNHFKKINYAYPLNMVTINLDYWKALSKSQKHAMLKAARETERFQWKRSRSYNKNALITIKNHDMIVSGVTNKLKAAMNKAAKKVINKFLANASSQEKNVVEQFIR